MIDDLLENVISGLDIKEKDIDMLNPLILAYIGDSVYEVYVRTILIIEHRTTVHNLHKMATKYVKASAQAEIIRKISDKLSEEEQNIIRRGRNAKSGTIPKNADVTEYKAATGFEALLGYLYLKKRNDRLMEILKEVYNIKNPADNG